jgi:hypothetical protein
MAQTDAIVSVPWYRTLNRDQWRVLIASNLGWAFDGFEIYALFLTVAFALHQLLACSFLRVSAGAFVVVIGDIADHLQGMLVEWQQPISLHRYGAAGNRVGVEHASNFRPRHMDRARYREPAAVDHRFGQKAGKSLHVFRWCFGQHSVAEIEDVRSPAEALAEAPHRFFQRRPSDDQQDRIEIALNRPVWLQGSAPPLLRA